MWREFKKFISRGNIIDLAVAVIIGSAFNKIVDSLVQDLLMPVIGIIVGGINLKALHFSIGGAVVSYGKFIQTIIDFFLIAVVIFILVKIANKIHGDQANEKIGEPKPVTSVDVLTEIRDILKSNQTKKQPIIKKETNETIVNFKRR